MDTRQDKETLTDDSRLEVDENGSRDMLAGASVAEEGGERGVGLVLFGVEAAVGLDAVFQTVQLPACISDLHASLPHMDRDHLALKPQRISSITPRATQIPAINFRILRNFGIL